MDAISENSRLTTQALGRLRQIADLRGRLAPTPSGWLHAGNGASFALTWLLTRAADGTLLLRIDDLDQQRRRPEYLEDIFRTIDWLGLDYDFGPTGPDDFLQHWSQPHRREAYTAALASLWEAGRLYACDCSRSQVKERNPDGIYRGYCRARELSKSQANVAWRYRLPPDAGVAIEEATGRVETVDLAETMGDFVLRRKNGRAAYQLASVVDDDRYGINFIVRGADLLPSTAAQYVLAGDLPESTFRRAAFYHHPLVLDEAAEKLSKSAGARSLRSWRSAGKSSAEVFATAKSWLGAPAEVAPEPAALLAWLRAR